jgi:hypothetical protein
MLAPKRKPNRFIVDEASNDDNSVVALHPATMDKLDIFCGDTILMKVYIYTYVCYVLIKHKRLFYKVVIGCSRL